MRPNIISSVAFGQGSRAVSWLLLLLVPGFVLASINTAEPRPSTPGSVTQNAALDLGGTVMLENKATVAGAIVTVTDARAIAESVYTDMQGRWHLYSRALQLPVTVRARASAAYADSIMPLSANGPRSIDLILHKHSSVQEVSDSLTASAHAASIRWKSAGTKQDFISQCHFCHQIGNAWTRRPKTEQEWTTTIKRMEGYAALITWKNEKDFAQTLAHDFKGQPVASVQTLAMHDDLPKAKMREWSFGGGMNYVHDVEQGLDGKLYGVDMSADKIWILDPATNVFDSISLPQNGLPLGGKFSGAVAPLGTFEAYHGPHSIVRGPDGRMYMTCSLSAEIAIFDPRTRKLEFVPTGGDTIYPHTLRFDKKGTLWFTFSLSNQIGRMDIRSHHIDVVDLPSNGVWRWMTDAMLPTVLKVSSWFGKKDMQVKLSHHQWSGEGRGILNLPYGIDVNPVDGSVWYSKLYSGYIGRLDPATMQVKEFKTPFPSPRRLRFDKSGTLWIPSFEAGVLMKFDTKTETFIKNYRLPVLAANEYETPYALAVHPNTQQIWIAANMSDRILRFDPKSEAFAAYPSPTRVTFMRDFIFLANGEVCTSNSNLPAAAIEGGRPKFMCLDPDAGSRRHGEEH